MTPCTDLKALLLDYGHLPAVERASIDAHIASCGDCREALKILSYVGDELSEACAAIEPPGGFRAELRSRVARETPIRRPSAIPEILDFVGWSAIAALVLAVTVWANVLPFDRGVSFLCVSAVFLWAVRFGLRVRAELK
jgi:hypothetical protein